MSSCLYLEMQFLLNYMCKWLPLVLVTTRSMCWEEGMGVWGCLSAQCYNADEHSDTTHVHEGVCGYTMHRCIAYITHQQVCVGGVYVCIILCAYVCPYVWVQIVSLQASHNTVKRKQGLTVIWHPAVHNHIDHSDHFWFCLMCRPVALALLLQTLEHPTLIFLHSLKLNWNLKSSAVSFHWLFSCLISWTLV